MLVASAGGEGNRQNPAALGSYFRGTTEDSALPQRALKRHRHRFSGLTKSRGFAWLQVLYTGPVGIFPVVSRFDAFERKCEKSLGVEVQIVRQSARRSDGFAIPRPDGLRFADSRNRL